MSDNFYNILEVEETASIEEIKKAYRRLSMICHPDKNNNNQESTAKFQKIAEAYETLGDKDKKREYDASRNNPFFKMMGQGQAHGPGGNTSVDELFSNLFGMQFGNMGSFGQGQGQGQNIRVFHNGVQVNAQGFVQGIQKPSPIIKNVLIPIDIILTGTTIPIDIERWIIQDGNKIFESETVYVNVPKGIDEGEIIVLREKGNIPRAKRGIFFFPL